jgi:hypothetical protein
MECLRVGSSFGAWEEGRRGLGEGERACPEVEREMERARLLVGLLWFHAPDELDAFLSLLAVACALAAIIPESDEADSVVRNCLIWSECLWRSSRVMPRAASMAPMGECPCCWPCWLCCEGRDAFCG